MEYFQSDTREVLIPQAQENLVHSRGKVSDFDKRDLVIATSRGWDTQ